MNTSGESWGCCPLPLPLTDGGAKTKQPSRLRGFPPYEGKHPLLHQKSNVVRDLFSRALGWPAAGQERQRPETMLVLDDESRGWHGGQPAQKDCD